MKTLLLAAVAGTMLLGGCGQRGPLYLPDQPPAQKRLVLPVMPAGPASPAAFSAAAASAAAAAVSSADSFRTLALA